MADDPPKKKRRKTAPKYGRRARGKKPMAMSPVPPAVEDVNPAIDDDVGPDPDVDEDHTIIIIGGSGPDNLHPAAERSDSGDVETAEDAINGGTSGRRTRASSKRGPSQTTNDKNKTIKSLRNKLYYKSQRCDAANDRVGGALKSELSEVKKRQQECKDLAFLELKALKDKNKELEALQAKAQAAAAKANASAEEMSNKLKARVARYSSSREKKEQELKNVRKRARAKVDSIEKAKSSEIAKVVADSEKAKAKEVETIQVRTHMFVISHATLFSQPRHVHRPKYRTTTASRFRLSTKLPRLRKRNARGRRSC